MKRSMAVGLLALAREIGGLIPLRYPLCNFRHSGLPSLVLCLLQLILNRQVRQRLGRGIYGCHSHRAT